ncbi:helix-turn-helix transcriptional regulator [Kineococcus sp. G2]|uniref:helix-turn-helix transcriptional regulator n=1 Tax=Kineococcus sp. G2 TaxID=3127484 RepID=UPI00301DD875
MDLLEIEDPVTQLRAGLTSLLRLVPGDVAAEVVVDVAGGGSRVTEVPELLVPMSRSDGQKILLTSPAVPHLLRHGDLPASRVEELCTPEDWARNPMRRLLLEPHRVPHAALTASLRRGRILGWGVNRSRPFADSELELMRSFEPFLRRAAHDRARASLIDALQRAVADGAGLLIFEGPHAVHVDTRAAELLELHDVRAEEVLGIAQRSLDTAGRPGALPTRAGTLRLQRRPAAPGATAVTLIDVSTDAAQSLLSPRQHLVLCHLSHGLTASAIARQLGVSVRTVQKHLENVYRALEVGDRLNAVLRGRELGLLPVLPDCRVLAAER